MPAPPLSNTFEGGTNGTTITAANSGGASGNAFSDVLIGGTGTPGITFDNTHVRGAFGCKVVGAATPGDVSGRWQGLGALTTDVYFRKYCYLTANPVADEDHLRAQTAAGGMSCGIRVTSTGKIGAQNAAFAAITALTGTVTVPLNQWFRVEARIRASTTVGQAEWRLYKTADSTTIDETLSASSLALGADTGEALFGNVDGNAASYTHWQDDIAVSTGGWIGPSVFPVKSFNPIPFQAQGRNL